MTDIGKIWANAEKSHRHLIESSHNVQNNIALIDQGIEYLSGNISNIVDWGPGGGFISKHLCAKFAIKKVKFVDIVEDHFDIIKENYGSVCGQLEFVSVKNGLNDLQLDNIDLLLAFSVIYHFPNLEYADNILNYWIKIKPKCIWLRNMFTDSMTWENNDRLDQNYNYLRGVVYNKNDFLDKFKDYNIINCYGKTVANTSANNIPKSLEVYSEVLHLELA